MALVGTKSIWEKYGAFLNSFPPNVNNSYEYLNGSNRIVRYKESVLFNQYIYIYRERERERVIPQSTSLIRPKAVIVTQKNNLNMGTGKKSDIIVIILAKVRTLSL